ncbi:MAG: sugar phosphate isomerase/epimerase family protein, partial [Pseudonocardiaceae bacterium]
ADKVCNELKTLGCEFAVVPWIGPEHRADLESARRFIAALTEVGKQVRERGLRFGYHNHDFEFAPLDGRIPYDVLLAETDPAAVALQLDLLWIVKGGQDPLGYFARYPGRFEMVHVKDSTGPPEYRQVDVGRGTIDFRRILARREQAGIRHAFVEHDDPADPLAFAGASYDYLERIGLGGRSTAPVRSGDP